MRGRSGGARGGDGREEGGSGPWISNSNISGEGHPPPSCGRGRVAATDRLKKEAERGRDGGGGGVKGGWRRAAPQLSLARRPRWGEGLRRLHDHFLHPFATCSISTLASARRVTRRCQSSGGYTHWEVDRQQVLSCS